MAGRIIIDTERCKGCGLCIEFCPKSCIVVSRQSNKLGYFPAEPTGSDCTGCAICALVCPDAVIEVHRDAPDKDSKVISNRRQDGAGVHFLEEKA